jgi:branched-chain amino acid transport system permease protein
VTIVLSGLGQGALYGFVGLGFAICFAAMGRFNFAFPQFIVFGIFMAYWVEVTLGLALGWSVVIAGVGCGLLAVVEYVIVFVPLERRQKHGGELVATVGFSIAVEGAIAFIWGSTPLGIPSPLPTRSLNVLGGKATPTALTLLGIIVLLAIGVEWLSRYTSIGLAIRAVRHDRDAAAVLGISPARVGVAVLIASAIIAGCLGPLVGSETEAVYGVGTDLAIGGFLAYAAAGEEAYLGTLIVGLVIGVVRSEIGALLNVNYQNVALLILLSVALVVKPSGIFGRGGLRAV